MSVTESTLKELPAINALPGMGGGLDLAAGLGQGLLGVLEVGGRQVGGDVEAGVHAGQVHPDVLRAGAQGAAGRRGLAAQRAGDPVQGRGELGGHDSHLRAGSVGDFGQGLKVLVGQQLGVGVAAVDGVEDLEDGARLTLSLEDGELGLALGQSSCIDRTYI